MLWAICRDAAERRELLGFFGTSILTLTLFLYFSLALPVLTSLLFLPFWIKKTKNGCKAASKLLYQCFSLAHLQQWQKWKHSLDREDHVLAVCDWGEMKQSVMKGQDLTGEKEDVIFLVDRLLLQQDGMAFQLERVWKLNLKLLPSHSLLISCMDLKFA